MSRAALNRQLQNRLREGSANLTAVSKDPFSFLENLDFQEEAKGGRGMEIYGNQKTFNMELSLATSIVVSRYFTQTLLEIEDFQQWLEEASSSVTNVQPWDGPQSSKTPSKAFSLVYTLAAMRVTPSQLDRLLSHDNLYLRALGCIYVRYTVSPSEIASLVSPLLEDDPVFAPWAVQKKFENGTLREFTEKMTFNNWLKSLLLDGHYGVAGGMTILPHIPAGIVSELRLLAEEADETIARARRNSHVIGILLVPGTRVRAKWSDGSWYYAEVKEIRAPLRPRVLHGQYLLDSNFNSSVVKTKSADGKTGNSSNNANVNVKEVVDALAGYGISVPGPLLHKIRLCVVYEGFDPLKPDSEDVLELGHIGFKFKLKSDSGVTPAENIKVDKPISHNNINTTQGTKRYRAPEEQAELDRLRAEVEASSTLAPGKEEEEENIFASTVVNLDEIEEGETVPVQEKKAPVDEALQAKKKLLMEKYNSLSNVSLSSDVQTLQDSETIRVKGDLDVSEIVHLGS